MADFIVIRSMVKQTMVAGTWVSEGQKADHFVAVEQKESSPIVKSLDIPSQTHPEVSAPFEECNYPEKNPHIILPL